MESLEFGGKFLGTKHSQGAMQGVDLNATEATAT